MAGDRRWIPDDMDTGRPSIARVYDYALGGGHNLASDRAVFEQLMAIQPRIREIAWTNRAFLRRVVLFMVESGITQFLDLGSGIPTVGNVHEIAQKANPECRVVYVDREDVAVAHSQLLLECNPLATVVEADIVAVDKVLNHPETRALLDFGQPVGVLALTVGHYVSDKEVQDVFERYRDAVVPGSMLGISHATDDVAEVRANEVASTAAAASGDGMYTRPRAEITRLFGDFDLVEPGLVAPSAWRPDRVPPIGDRPTSDGLWAAVGVKGGLTPLQRARPGADR
ncbi:SAM-dependent methyltransferase [Kibdelosporangium lantanae]